MKWKHHLNKGRAKKVGLALGGGGARGLAHTSVLEVFDELNVTPHCITGTSIGAVIGALYASGLTGAEIRELVEKLLITKGTSWEELLEKRKSLMKWIEVLVPDFRQGGLLRIDRLMDHLYQEIDCDTFEELQIPLRVTATDYWRGEQVVIDSGPLYSGVRASMALPGIFAPIKRDGRVLVDGGLVNPVPCDLLPEECDIAVAVDLLTIRSGGTKEVPGIFDSILQSFRIAQNALQQDKMENRRPDILVRPEIKDVHVLSFDKGRDVFRQAEPAIKNFRRELKAALSEQ